jgi:hypothetical protein
LTAIGLTVTSAVAAKKGPIRKLNIDRTARVVPLFDGLDQGLLNVRLSAQNTRQSNVYITNATDRPLTVAVPKSAAAVHVLKQVAGNPPVQGQNQNLGANFDPLTGLLENQGMGQSVAGQFSPFTSGTSFPGFNQFPQGNSLNGAAFVDPTGNGFFSVPPKATVQVKLQTVCLDHGKPDPRPKMRYVLLRFQDYSKDKKLQHLIESFDPQKTDREAVQAAAWHLSNGMTWKALMAKKRLNGIRAVPYFTRQQIDQALEFVDQAMKFVEQSDEQRIAAKRL